MKNIASVVFLALFFFSCDDKKLKPEEKQKEENYTKIRFAPPIVKADADVQYDRLPPKQAQALDATAAKFDTTKGDASQLPSTGGSSTSVNSTNEEGSKKIIWEGDVSFEVFDVAATRKNILQTLKKLGGYV